MGATMLQPLSEAGDGTHCHAWLAWGAVEAMAPSSTVSQAGAGAATGRSFDDAEQRAQLAKRRGKEGVRGGALVSCFVDSCYLNAGIGKVGLPIV